MKRYRQLNPDELIQVGDFFSSKLNPPPPIGCIKLTGDDLALGKKADYNKYLNFYRIESVPRPPTLARRYRLVRDSETIQMFDWFTTTAGSTDKMPDPDEQFHEGWVQIIPGEHEGLLDGDPRNRDGFKFARFVDCFPVKSTR